MGKSQGEDARQERGLALMGEVVVGVGGGALLQAAQTLGWGGSEGVGGVGGGVVGVESYAARWSSGGGAGRRKFASPRCQSARFLSPAPPPITKTSILVFGTRL